MVLLSLGPLVLELVLVGIILATLFDIRYLIVVVVTMAFISASPSGSPNGAWASGAK